MDYVDANGNIYQVIALQVQYVANIWRDAAAGKQCRLRIRHVLHVWLWQARVKLSCQKKLNEAERSETLTLILTRLA